MNMQTSPTGVAVSQDVATVVPQDQADVQVRRTNSLQALEQEINELEAMYAQPITDQAGTQPGTSTQQNLTHNSMIPSDGADTSTNQAAATSDEDLTYRERLKNAKSYYDKEITQTRNQVKELQTQLSNAQNPPQSPEELTALKAANPEMFRALEAMVNNNNNSNTEARVEELMSELAKTRQEKAVGEVVSKHKDFYDVVKSDDWNEWKVKQPQGIQDMITGNADNSDAMIRALDLYKFDKGTTPLQAQTNTSQTVDTSAADAVTGAQSTDVNTSGQSNKRIWTRSEIARMSIQEYEAFESDILLAQTENRIQDDTSRPW